MIRPLVFAVLLAAALPVRAQLEVGVVPSGDVFEPLWADPLWPIVSASYHRYIDDDNLENVASLALGATIPVYRWENRLGLDGVEWGLQAGIFSDFDQDRTSRDQFSADYAFSGYVAGRRGDVSGMLRLYHRSSHVGDEYLTNDSGVVREDFALERIDVIGSYDVIGNPYDLSAGLVRVYGGAGRVLTRPTPREFGYLRTQWGGEVRSSTTLGDFLRPVAAVDVTHQEGNDFKPDLSVRAGLQIDHPTINGRNVRFLIEYYNGKEPNGQFFEDDVQIVGTGVFFSL